MFLKNVFGSIPDMSAEKVRAYAGEHAAETFTLLDVRTPEEYEVEHIPGSRLIPISELADRLDELDTDKPTIVY